MNQDFNGGVTVMGDPTYVAAVIGQLRQIEADRGAGAVLLRWHARQWMHVSGVTSAAANANRVVIHADSRPDEAIADDPIGANPASGLPGAGFGSSVRLRFNPTLRETAPASVRQPICTLVHELTHALRMRHGLSTAHQRMGDDFDSIEEFYAILIENIYRSGRGLPLRQSHHGWAAMNPPRAYWNEPRYDAIFDRLFNTMHRFAEDMAAVTVPYNPLRDYSASGSFGTGFFLSATAR